MRKGIEPKSQVSIVFTGTFQNDEMHRLTLRAMAEMLSGNLHRTLREELGGTYGVSVEPRFTQRPTQAYPHHDLVRLRSRAHREPHQDGLRGDRGVQKGRPERRARGRRTRGADARIRNEQPAEQVPAKPPRVNYQYGGSVEDVFNIRPSVERLTASLIHEAARTYLDTRRYVEVTLLPEVRTP